MPRTTTLDCPGCPPLRALTFDVLGLVKGNGGNLNFPIYSVSRFCLDFLLSLVFPSLAVIEARGKEGEIPKVVERWGEPDFSKSVLAASLADRKFDPVRYFIY